MAGESRLYTDIRVYIAGALLTEENQVTVNRDAGNREVMTTARGFAGVSAGAGMTTISIRNAVPAAGVEFDPGDAMASRQTIECTLFRAGRQLTGKFYVMKDSSQHAANAESELNFDLLGPFAKWQ